MNTPDYGLPKCLNPQLVEAQVEIVLKVAIKAKKLAEKKFGRNVIDPFAALFEVSGFDADHAAWKLSETARQAQKTLQNSIGIFHQNILGSARDWEDMKTGSMIDLVSKSKRIIAEVKNKFSTISGGKLSELYYTLDRLVSPKSSVYKDFTAYYVTIIPKKGKRGDTEFTPSDKDKGQKCPSNPLIRQIDGSTFYDLVFEEKNVLKQLYRALPKIINHLRADGKFLDDKTGNEPTAEISDQEIQYFMRYFDAAFPSQ
jgi:hypothetical protein